MVDSQAIVQTQERVVAPTKVANPFARFTEMLVVDTFVEQEEMTLRKHPLRASLAAFNRQLVMAYLVTGDAFMSVGEKFIKQIR